MERTASPKLALKRGALITAANWPVVVLQSVADSVFTALLAVPVVGGAALVVLTSNLDPRSLMQQGVRRAVPTLAAALLAHPLALSAFLVAVVVVLVGGSLLMAFVKGGAIAVLCAADRDSGPLERPPLQLSAVSAASRFTLDGARLGSYRYFGRFVRLGGALYSAYAVLLAVGAIVITRGGPASALDAPRLAGVTAGLVTAFTLVNLMYLLTQIVIAVDDCDVWTGLRRMSAFVVSRPGDIGIVFAVASTLVALGTAASLLATAALGLIAFVPFVGLAALPLSLGAWVARSVLFQFLGLTALVAYLRLYRLTTATGD